MRFFILLALTTVTSSLRIPHSKYDVKAVYEVIGRLPKHITKDIQSIDIDSRYELLEDESELLISAENGVNVKATSPTAALYAVNYYLRNFCKSQVSWNGSHFGDECKIDSDIKLSFKAPQVRYFGNPCTFGYSFAWWKWEDWDQFIDWLALNGFNMVLAPVGQEAIWRDLFLEMGVTRKELDDYFTGPTYLPWHRMGNVKSYGGPLSDEFMDSQLALNKMIVAKLTRLGIVPVLPTFAGFVPDQLKQRYTSVKFIRNSCWNNFNSTQSCLLSVYPNDSLFQDIAKGFLQMQNEVYGVSASHVYSADPLNEVAPVTKDYQFLLEIGQAIHKGCIAEDKHCIWLFQSWTFSYSSWSQKEIQLFLSTIPVGHLLVLDLYSEVRPLWKDTKSFYGHPFIFGLLHNFGGTTQMRGNIDKLNKDYQRTLVAENTMVGGGLTMEAINQNYVIYQFMVDRMWSQTLLDQENWLNTYAISRYGVVDKSMRKAWNLLLKSLYLEPIDKANNQKFSIFLYERPQFNKRIKYWFNTEVFFFITGHFDRVKSSLWNNPLFRIDYNNVFREHAQNLLGNRIILRVYESFGLSDDAALEESCALMNQKFLELEKYANFDSENWEESAQDWASTENEAIHFTRNTRDLMTLWGPKGQNIDYAHREYSGLISSYYRNRWLYFCDYLKTHRHFNRTEFDEKLFYEVEKPFVELF